MKPCGLVLMDDESKWCDCHGQPPAPTKLLDKVCRNLYYFRSR